MKPFVLAMTPPGRTRTTTTICPSIPAALATLRAFAARLGVSHHAIDWSVSRPERKEA